jgi:hypothetical protein
MDSTLYYTLLMAWMHESARVLWCVVWCMFLVDVVGVLVCVLWWMCFVVNLSFGVLVYVVGVWCIVSSQSVCVGGLGLGLVRHTHAPLIKKGMTQWGFFLSFILFFSFFSFSLSFLFDLFTILNWVDVVVFPSNTLPPPPISTTTTINDPTSP